jgi:NitT/TauT family transport system permease protein
MLSGEVSRSEMPEEVPHFLPLPGVSWLELVWLRAKVPLLTLLGVIVFVAIWQWQQAYVQKIPALFIPPPSAVYKAMIDGVVSGEIPREMLWSFRNFGMAFVIATLLGVPLGLLMGSVPIIDKLLGPYIFILWSTPRIAFYPIIIVAMGFEWPSKVLLITMACFFTILINTLAGVQTVDKSLIRVGKSFGASSFMIYTKIVLPFTLAFIMTGLRMAVTRGLVVMYVSEVFGSPSGIGALVVRATNLYNTPLAFAGLVILLVSSLIIVYIFQILERVVTPWKVEVDV